MTQIAQGPHALAIIAALEADDLTVGDGVAPRVGNPPKIVAPCVVVHMVPGGAIDGTAGDPDGWADARFQLTAVGRLAAEARRYADLAAAALETHGLAVAGRAVRRLRPIEPWGRVERDHDVTPPLFYATRTYGVWTFPG
jgi:hypothetical protein